MAAELKLVHKFAILCQWLTILSAGAEVIGRVGSVINRNIDYIPSNDSSRFFLNAQDPASISGTVSKIQYCYTLESDVMVRLYQATVGFYRYRDNTYVLSSSFNITKTNTLDRASNDSFQCEDMMIPEVEVREGEVIGVCSRDFDDSIGRVILVSEGEEMSDSLFRNGLDDRNSFCYMEGTVPMTFTRDQILEVSNHHLLLNANITGPVSPTIPPDPMLEDFGIEGLSEVAMYGIIAGVLTLLVGCCIIAFICCCCCCCIKRRRGRSSVYIQYKASRKEITNPSGYMSFEEMNRIKEAQRNGKPHVMGPKNFSSSGSAAARNTVFSSTDGEDTTSQACVMLDTTAVVYTELLAKDTIKTGESFEVPAPKEDQIYDQLEANRTIKRGEIDLERRVWRSQDKEIAVHLRQSAPSDGEKMNFLQEAAILAQFKHPNIIAFYGVLVDGLQVTIVEESLSEHLKTFLKRLKPAEPGTALSRTLPKLLLNYSQQIAIGMKYLSTRGFVHGKVMASSIMLSSANVCKIKDFSWSRDIANSCVHHLNAPVKWSAPEVISHTMFSTASDVWSYGCLLYEMWSLGRDPFVGESNVNTVELIKIGWRLAPPTGCPKVIYELMIESWNPDADERPSFTELVMDLTRVEALVLNIPQKLLDKHPQCAELGASLNIGKLMYKNLQTLYQNQTQSL